MGKVKPLGATFQAYELAVLLQHGLTILLGRYVSGHTPKLGEFWSRGGAYRGRHVTDVLYGCLTGRKAPTRTGAHSKAIQLRLSTYVFISLIIQPGNQRNTYCPAIY